jgi:release factor glutamine methyltransferase
MTQLSCEHAWSLCGVEFALELWPDVFQPTSTSELLAQALDVQPGEVVIDLGCGSGFFSILAAKRGATKVYAVDIMPQAVALTLRNAKRNGVESRIEAFTGSLFEPLPGVRSDLIVDDVSGIAEEVARATPWYPPSIPSGGPDGAQPTIEMLQKAPDHLLPNGRLIFPVLSLGSEQRILEAAQRLFADLRLRTQRLFPIPQSLHEALRRLKEHLASGALRLIQRGSRLCWQLRVFEARSASSVRLIA